MERTRHLDVLLIWTTSWVLVRAQANICPPLYVEVDEHIPVGSVLFSFSSQAVDISLESHDPERTSGYLNLQSDGDMYNITLERYLDLTLLNPRPQPVPDSNEKLNCTYTDTDPGQDYPEVLRALEYSMLCIVTAAGGTQAQVVSTVRIAIRDVNDNRPLFHCGPYFKTISELAPVSTTIFSLRGLAFDQDLDGGISGFQLEQTGGQGLFAMQGGASEGLLVVVGPLDYDEGPDMYSLNVTVTDIGDPPLTSWTLVNIYLSDGDDLNPEFDHTMHSLALPEQTPGIVGQDYPTTPPLHAEDKDLGLRSLVMYEVTTGHQFGGVPYFSINAFTAQITPLRMLHRRETDQFILNVKAYQVDAPSTRYSQAVVVVTVEDSNVNHPLLSPSHDFSVSIPENAAVGYHVTSVMATDEDQGVNAVVAVSIVDKTGIFTVDPSSGVITVMNMSALDREKQDTFTLIVYAAETESSERYTSDNITVTVHLMDVNDNAPVFIPSSHFTFHTNISDSYQTLGRISALDADEGSHGEVTFSIVSGNEYNVFDISPSGGDLVSNNTMGSRLSLPSQISLLVQATDGGFPSLSSYASVSIVIHQLEESYLHFTKDRYHFSLDENVPGILVGTVSTSGSPHAVMYILGPSISTFQLHEDSGDLFTTSSLDREVRSVYMLTVTARDSLTSATATIIVSVQDTNDNPPVFHQLTYTKTISMDTQQGVSVLKVTATDDDMSANSFITYSLLQPSSTFLVHPVEGEIIVMGALQQNVYNLSVIARDHGNPSLSSSVKVTLYATRASNDHSPVFSEFVYDVEVPENVSIHTSLVAVFVSDDDDEEAGTVLVNIVHGDPTNMFYLDEHLVLRPRLPLDYESQKFYSLILEASDMGIIPRTATTILTIAVTDVNDNPPQFLPHPDSIHIQGPLLTGTDIFKFLATDADSTNNNQIEYSIASTNLPNMELKPITGVLKATSNITFGNYTISISASNPDSNLETFCNLSVFIEAVSDWPLVDRAQMISYFNESHPAPFNLNDVNARLVLDGTSQLPDAGIVYSVTEISDGTPPVDLNAGNGAVRIIEPLDRERLDYISMVIGACREDRPLICSYLSLMVRVLDSNDEAPYFGFTEYRAMVEENTLPGTPVLSLQAEDDDLNPQLSYSIVGNDRIFEVHSASNVASVYVNTSIDFESLAPSTEGILSFQIIASDGLHLSDPVDVKVKVIDSNDNTPRFTSDVYNASIPENAAPCTEVMTVSASDPDTMDEDKVIYAIIEGNHERLFTLDYLSGIISLTCDNASSLDREEEPHYQLTIRAFDTDENGVDVQVIIVLDDVNDNAPFFLSQSYTEHTKEGEESLNAEITLMLNDLDEGQNGRISVTLDDNKHFTIEDVMQDLNHTMVNIGVATALDREALPTSPDGSTVISLTVTATDHGTPPKSTNTTVLVFVDDINDTPPTFDRPFYEVTVSEAASMQSVLATVTATDHDLSSTSPLIYDILAGNINESFGIVNETGEVYVNSLLDRYTRPEYNLTILASDGYFNTTMTLHITLLDTNSHAPFFTQTIYYFRVTENDPLHTAPQLLGEVHAVDVDEGRNGQVVYTVANSSGLFRFSNPLSGVLWVEGVLDREETDRYTITIIAHDRASPPRMSMCQVEVEVLDRNDNAPHFINAPFVMSVAEHSPPGSPLSILKGPVHADDLDTGINSALSYTLIGPGSPHFDLDPNEGTLAVGNTSYTDLDREVNAAYYLKVIVSDRQGSLGALTSTASLTILITDINDHSPSWQSHTPMYVSIPEDIASLTWVAQMHATDADMARHAALVYNIVMQPQPPRFYINTYTGDIYTTGGLDREVISLYSLNISVWDPGYSENASIHSMLYVTVTDVNDNPPGLINTRCQFLIEEMLNSGSLVGHINASDPDLGANGRLRFSLHGAVPMIIGELTGVILTTSQLDRESVPGYTFQVIVSDMGTPSLSVTVDVMVNVLDVNDNDPHFTENNYTRHLLNNSPVGTLVYHAHATDADEGDNARLHYSLEFLQAPDDALIYFHIDPTSGLITSTQPVDRGVLQQLGLLADDGVSLMLRVVATDAGLTPRAGVMVLTLVLDDISNVEPPRFFTSYIAVEVTEEAPPGTPVIDLSVFMTTSDASLPVTYNLLNTDFFTMSNASSGLMLTSDARLDRERQEEHVFAVALTDHFQPPTTSVAMVSVSLLDINDNAPVFDILSYKFLIEEDNLTHLYPVGQVTALDTDNGTNADILYSLDKQHHSDDVEFSVEGETGLLSVSGCVEWSIDSLYHLVMHASDRGSPPRSASVSISVMVRDSNNHNPIFSPLPPIINMSNLITPATKLLEVTASDEDGGASGTVIMTHQQPTDACVYFYIEQYGNGQAELKFSHLVDGATCTSASVTLIAYDLGTPARTSNITIEVIRTPDSVTRPKFPLDTYVVEIPLSYPELVEMVKLDAGDYTIDYLIIDGNDNGIFILSNSGSLSITNSSSLDLGLYELTILAYDSWQPPHIDNTQVIIQVIEDITGPVFTQKQYTASLLENALPWLLLVDLNTTYEQMAIPVVYTLVDERLTTKFHVDNRTGQLWSVDALDREEHDLYIIEIRVNSDDALTNQTRFRRQTGTRDNIAMVTVTVEDVNDNSPMFTKDPFIYAMSPSVAFGFELGRIQAVDADAGENSLLHYDLYATNDAQVFYIHPTQGTLHAKGGISAISWSQFNFLVAATDSAGLSHNVSAAVIVFALDDTVRALLVASISPDAFVEYEDQLLRGLGDILGWSIHLERLEPHTEITNGYISVDLMRTDMYLYAVDEDNGVLVSMDDILQRVSKQSEAIEVLFSLYAIESIGAVSQRSAPTSLGYADMALIALACFIVALALVAGCFLLAKWNKTDNKQEVDEDEVYAEMVFRKGRDNPSFVDPTTVYAEDLDMSGHGGHTEQFAVMETQGMSLYLPPESDTSSMQSLPPEVSTFLVSGSRQSGVVTSEPPCTSSDQNLHAPWVTSSNHQAPKGHSDDSEEVIYAKPHKKTNGEPETKTQSSETETAL